MGATPNRLQCAATLRQLRPSDRAKMMRLGATTLLCV